MKWLCQVNASSDRLFGTPRTTFGPGWHLHIHEGNKVLEVLTKLQIFSTIPFMGCFCIVQFPFSETFPFVIYSFWEERAESMHDIQGLFTVPLYMVRVIESSFSFGPQTFRSLCDPFQGLLDQLETLFCLTRVWIFKVISFVISFFFFEFLDVSRIFQICLFKQFVWFFMFIFYPLTK